MYADRIRTLRTRLGWSRQKLGDMLGVSATAVFKWENAQSQPDIPTLQRLADIFGVTMDELCDHTANGAQGSEITNIMVMSRAFRQMTPEEQEKLLAVGRTLFEHAFREAGNK